MSFSKLTDDLNIIQSLADQPTMTANELKKKFDESGNKIKDYINKIFLEEIDSEFSERYKTIQDDLKKYVGDKLEDLEKKIDDNIKKILEESVAKSTNYNDFVISDNTAELSTNIQYGVVQKDLTFSKDGYKPIAISGYYFSNLRDGSSNPEKSTWNMNHYFLKTITNNNAVVNVNANAVKNYGNILYQATVHFQILWIKIK